MPATVNVVQIGPVCWRLDVKLIPKRNNDPKLHEFKLFLQTKGLMIDKDLGWSACGYHQLEILVGDERKADVVKGRIEKWGEKELR